MFSFPFLCLRFPFFSLSTYALFPSFQPHIFFPEFQNFFCIDVCILVGFGYGFYESTDPNPAFKKTTSCKICHLRYICSTLVNVSLSLCRFIFLSVCGIFSRIGTGSGFSPQGLNRIRSVWHRIFFSQPCLTSFPSV